MAFLELVNSSLCLFGHNPGILKKPLVRTAFHHCFSFGEAPSIWFGKAVILVAFGHWGQHTTHNCASGKKRLSNFFGKFLILLNPTTPQKYEPMPRIPQFVAWALNFTSQMIDLFSPRDRARLCCTWEPRIAGFASELQVYSFPYASLSSDGTANAAVWRSSARCLRNTILRCQKKANMLPGP